MNICFTLSMPNRGSWNGGWSGEGTLYAIVKNFGRGKRAEAQAQRILSQGLWYYRWNDGWGASISAKEVSTAESRQIRQKSKGFSGYDWMVESILVRGKILADHEIPEMVQP